MKVYNRRQKAAASEVAASVSPKIGASVTGAIALFHRLEQKLQLEMSDRKLLEFMSSHAALALYPSAPLAQGWNCAGAYA